MIKIEIGKENFLERRSDNIWGCKTDQFGTSYCPTGLATARPYTSYYQADSYEREASTIDYQTGSAVANNGSVIDYTSKTSSTSTSSPTITLEYGNYQYGYFRGWKPIDAAGSVVYYEMSLGGHELWLRYNNGKLEYGNYQYGYFRGWKPIDAAGSVVYYEMSLGGHELWLRATSVCPSGSTMKNGVCETTTLSCPSGYSDNGSNCKKTVPFTMYQYTCPSGYTASNTGMTSCSKTDPNTTTDNSSTLSQPCNSSTPPTGNCSKSISFKYYEYLCKASNNFLEPIKNINKGLTACSKTDTNKEVDNTGTLDDACNSSTPPVNNCQSTEYTCDSNLFKPVYVGGKWVCSPYMCDSDMKCGYGTCDSPTTPSTNKYMDPAYNPLQYITNNKCNGPLCDYVLNKEVSYCESKQCPKGDDIIQDSGKCYKLECPAGTYVSGGKCIKSNY